MSWTENRIEKYRQIAEKIVAESGQTGEALVDFTIAKDVPAAHRSFWMTFFFGIFSFFTSLKHPEFLILILTDQRLILAKMNYLGQISDNTVSSYQRNGIQIMEQKQNLSIDFLMFKIRLKLQVQEGSTLDLKLGGTNYAQSSQRIVDALSNQV